VARPLPQPMVKPPKRVEKSKPTQSAQPAPAKSAPAKARTALTVKPKLPGERARPLERACAWLAIGAAVAIYITAMCVIIQA
jgi:hypothetical protein